MITIIKFLPVLLLLIPVTSYSLPPEFTAQYTAEKYGMAVAEAVYKLNHTDNGVTFTQNSAATGLAAFFSKETLSETSKLSLHNGQLLLDEYHYIQKGSEKDRDVHVNITWNNTNDTIEGVIAGTASGNSVQHKTDKPAWDTLSFQIPIMLSIPDETITEKHNIIVKGQLRTYEFVNHGKDEIYIGSTAIDAIKIERKSSDKSKPLFLWIAPVLKNLPVKIEKWKKGKPHITMLIDSVTFSSNETLQFKVNEDFDDL